MSYPDVFFLVKFVVVKFILITPKTGETRSCKILFVKFEKNRNGRCKKD